MSFWHHCTQYLSFGSANEVFFNVSYDFRDCTFVDNCHPYVTLSRYDRNSVGNAAQQIDPSNYQYLTGSETTSQFGTGTTGGGVRVTGIERPSSFTGFYLGIQDTGTCGTVRRVLVYYLVCPARVSGLVSFPQTPVPLQSSANTVYSGSCAPNSHAVTSLEVEITSTTSVCTERALGGARCECDAGYSINGTSCEGKALTLDKGKKFLYYSLVEACRHLMKVQLEAYPLQYFNQFWSILTQHSYLGIWFLSKFSNRSALAFHIILR